MHFTTSLIFYSHMSFIPLNQIKKKSLLFFFELLKLLHQNFKKLFAIPFPSYNSSKFIAFQPFGQSYLEMAQHWDKIKSPELNNAICQLKSFLTIGIYMRHIFHESFCISFFIFSMLSSFFKAFSAKPLHFETHVHSSFFLQNWKQILHFYYDICCIGIVLLHDQN